MHGVLEILLAASLMVAACLILASRRRPVLEDVRAKQREKLRLIARELKLELVEGSEDAGDSVAGWIDGFYVDIWTPSRTGEDFVRVSVDCEGAIPVDLTIIPRAIQIPAGFSPEQSLIHDAPVINVAGSWTFESRVEVRGHELSARALLDEEARMLVLNVVGRMGAWVDRGVVGWCTNDQVRVPVFVIVRRLIELANALSIEASAIPERLRKIALEDEQPMVRANCLWRLVERFPGSEEARRACEDGIRDGDAAVRLLAAKHSGEKGLELIREIARTENTPHETRLDALRHLARVVPEQAIEPLFEALSSRSKRMQNAALQLICELPQEVLPIDRLLDAISSSSQLRPSTADLATANALARALAKTKNPRAESALLQLLGREELVLKTMAAEALGAIGSTLAVESLLIYTKGVLLDSHLKGIAKTAIEKIQSRAEGAETGTLSIIEDRAEERGALSVNPDQGAVSLPK